MKKNLKRPLSIVLALCLIMASIVTGGTGILADAASVKAPNVSMNDVTFVAPEVIYLYPNAQSSTNATSTPFEYYVNNNADGTVPSNATLEKIGKIYFTYSGTTTATLSYKFFNEALSTELSGGTVTLSDTSLISGGSLNIVSGSSPSLATTVNGCYIRWALNYTDSIDGIAKVAYAYTYVYKPYVVPIAAGADGGTGAGGANWAGSATWISGIHSLTEGPSIAKDDWDSNWYGYTRMDSFSAFISADSTGYVGNNAQTGSKAMITSGFTTFNDKATLGYTVFSNSGSTGYALTIYNNSNPFGAYGSESASTMTAPVKNYEVGKYRKNTKNIQACMYSSSYGNLYIDTSRYSNLNQIPNLGVGLVVSDDEESSGNSGVWYIADFTGRSTGGYNTWHQDADNRGTYYNDHGDLIASQGTGPTNTSYNELEGVRYAGAWPRTLLGSTSTQGATQMYMVKGFYGNEDGGYYASSHTVARMQATYYNKATLRTAVKRATAKMALLGVNGVSSGANITSCYFEANSNYKWTNLQTAYKNAVIGLTKLNSTDNPATLATNLNTALNELATSVTFNGNGGTLTGTTSTYVGIGTNASTTLDAPCTATRSGYTFLGWNTTSNATEGTTDVTVGYNNTVYAIWSKSISANFWRINGNISSAETALATLFNNDTTASVTASQPTQSVNYDGRTLTWVGFTTETTATAATPSSTSLTYSISGGESFNSLYSGNVTLTFDANGGTNAPSKQTAKQYLNANSAGVTGTGNTFTISSTQPVKNGCSFHGWAYDSNATIADYQPGDDVTGVTLNTTLYAVWSPNVYYIKYNSGGGTGTMEISTHYYGVPSPLNKNLFTRQYTVTYNSHDGRPNTTDTAVAQFIGWATTSSGQVAYADEEIVTAVTKADGATVNFFAKWTLGSVTLPNITRKGYSFRGWYTNSSLTNLAGGAGEEYTPTSNATLHAMWDPNAYTVTYNGNGATGGATSPSNHIYDTSSALSKNMFAQNYTVTFSYNGADAGETPATLTAASAFSGWALTADGPAIYGDEENVLNLAESGTTTLYATWTNGPVTLPAPEKSGFVFAGWYSDEGLNNSIGNAGESYTPGTNTAVYAKWTKVVDPVLVPKEGSTTVINDQTKLIYGLIDRDNGSATELLNSGFCGIEGGEGYLTYEYSNEDNVIGTGTKVNLYRADGVLMDTYTIVIFGDNNGDGYVNLSDCIDFAYYDAYMNSTYEYSDLTTPNVLAMDVDGDGYVTANDMLIVAYYVAYMVDFIDQTGVGTHSAY